MVVSVEAENEADIHVRNCVAHDGSRLNIIELTDEVRHNVDQQWRYCPSIQKVPSSIEFAYSFIKMASLIN